MKPTLSSLIIRMFTGVTLLLISARAARAEGSAYRASLTEAALRTALGERVIPLLEVVPPAGGREEQLLRLQRVLDTRRDRRINGHNPSKPHISPRATTILAQDHSWYLQVGGDGSQFTYRGNIDDPAEVGAAAGFTPLNAETLERAGRTYIAQQLAPLVTIPDGEKLVFLGTKYLREGSATETDRRFTSAVVANIALFGREVQGTFVAGAGSKIAVWFSNTGEPVGFDVDWPTYRVLARTQATLGIDRVWERMATYVNHPLEQVKENLSRFECGYVDRGVHKRQGSVLQAGCFAHHDGRTADEFKYASIEVIPIGEPVVEDAQWPLTHFVAAGQLAPTSSADPDGPDA
jgi:hypothetical protein